MPSSPAPVPRAHGEVATRGGLMLAGVLLLAANLRAGITSVGPVMGEIRADLGISGAAASFLIAVPVIGFAVFSPLTPGLARRFGLERTLGGSLLVLAAAIVLRSLPLTGAIWAGTVVLGAAVAALNVLIPALVKREYPHRVGAMTGVYSALQSGVAAVAAGLAVPIAGMTTMGWRLSLGVWAGLALIGFAVFLPQMRRRADAAAQRTDADAVRRSDAPADPAHVGSMWAAPMAWWVTLYMGTQSMVYYTVITWWPAIEQDAGVPAAVAGWHQFVFQSFGILGSLSAAALLHRLRTQSALTAVAAVLAAAGIAGQLTAPGAGIVWMALIGVAAGMQITIALSLFGLRTRTHHEAAALSGMAQSAGYLLAALGPIALGVLHDATGSWRVPLMVLLAATIPILVTGIVSGRPRLVGERRR